ncbi:MAG: SpoIVB peptidase S55 domain-containing protein [Candidatus Aminicenantales bacterium]
MTIKHIRWLALFVVLVGGPALASSLIFPLELVKPGLKGKGKSVFLGSAIEEFDVEILGVIENVQPKKHIILARLSSRALDTSGVVQGMSGSPVYIEGKLVGAVAYAFTFAKEAIAGLTPIQEMLTLAGEKSEPRPAQPFRMPLRSSMTIEDLTEVARHLFSSRSRGNGEDQLFQTIGVPLIFGGFSPQAVDRARGIFSRLGFIPVLSGTAAQVAEKVPPPDLTLREGDPVAVQLVGGDLNVAALGTVTHIDGNKVYAFGHPLYNLGPVDYGMAKANVLAVVPSLEASFKLASLGPRIGSFVQDRTSGAFGEVGRMPKLIPLNVRMGEPGGQARSFKLELVNDKILSPLLVNLTLSSLLTSELRSHGNLSVEIGGDLYLDNGANVRLDDLFSGNFDNAVTNFSGLLTAIVYYIANNEFEDVGIHRIDLSVRPSEEAKFCYLERVWLDKYEVHPGERIQVKVFYRTFGGETVQETVEIEAPPLTAGSEFYLIIGDAVSMHQLEMNLYRSQDFMPRNLAQLIRLLNNLRKNNRIYFKMLASKPGLFLKGEELPNLPPSLKAMFSSPRAAASAPTELTKSTLRDYQLAIPYVFRGLASIPVKIKS